MSLKWRFGVVSPEMVIDMNDARLESIEQIREFLAGTADLTFTIPGDPETLHGFVATVAQALPVFRAD
jgi:hypothetical protein